MRKEKEIEIGNKREERKHEEWVGKPCIGCKRQRNPDGRIYPELGCWNTGRSFVN